MCITLNFFFLLTFDSPVLNEYGTDLFRLFLVSKTQQDRFTQLLVDYFGQ